MKLLTTTLALGALSCGLAACSPSSINVPTPRSSNSPTNYIQIERLARPAVKELTEKFTDHAISNGVEPYSDPTLQGSIVSFASAFRGANYGTTIASILIPDEIQVDLSQSNAGGYLGVETGGALGGTFGGRKLTDDVIDDSLLVFFGNGLSALKILPDDHQENNCLTKQNVTQSASQYQATFPYVATPH